MTSQEIKIYWNVINPISGCTLEQELEKQKAWGGRLPYETTLSLIRRKIIPPLITSPKKQNVFCTRTREDVKTKDIKKRNIKEKKDEATVI